MHYIAHRINTLKELQALPTQHGAELDIRDSTDGSLHIAHDPFQKGELLEPWLAQYRHGTLILNVKSERIEWRVLELVQKHGIEDYFFLDSSIPMMMAMSAEGNTRQAVRFSEVEPLALAEAMRGRAEWVWVDCFTRLPITYEAEQQLRNWGYKLCLVSPELQGRPEDVEPYKSQLAEYHIRFDAVCTKLANVGRWGLAL